jgi:hypothetical protein
MSQEAEAMGEVSPEVGLSPDTEASPAPDSSGPTPGFLPPRPPRAEAESVVVRVIATAGVIGISTAVGAILAASSVAGWVIALVVSTLSVVLAAVLWRSRRL